ncbi:MAG: LicD family protein [Clostridia bacterium]|nr:LicD family protein [Clostridia bacterium]
MENDIKLTQNILIEMAKVFHQFCVSHNLKYYMLGGTLLGAVRHGGFIPWDDDMDFGMPREDYEKMLSLRHKIDDGFSLKTHKDEKNFGYGFCKMYNENTTYIEKSLDTYTVGGVFIDIFPIDNIGDDYQKALALSKKIHRRKRIVSGIFIRGERKSRSLTIISKFLRLLPKTNRWYEWPFKVVNKYKNKNSKYVTNIYGAWGDREIVPMTYLGTPKLYNFEETQLYGVEKYDEYLSNIYGDYMTPPPPEKRIGHSIYYVDFNKPYKQYIAEQKMKNYREDNDK